MDSQLLIRELDLFSPETRIVSGGAKGADSLAESYAHDHNRHFSVFIAEWDKYGLRAGSIRNAKMLDYIIKESSSIDKCCVLAFPGGPGTSNMIMLAKRAGVAVKQIHINEIEL